VDAKKKRKQKMSSTAQRAQLQSQIWKIANDVRGSIDGWDFKQYVLGTLFYRFISENFSNYIEAQVMKVLPTQSFPIVSLLMTLKLMLLKKRVLYIPFSALLKYCRE